MVRYFVVRLYTWIDWRCRIGTLVAGKTIYRRPGAFGADRD